MVRDVVALWCVEGINWNTVLTAHKSLAFGMMT